MTIRTKSLTVITAAALVDLPVDLALFLFRKLDARIGDKWSAVRPGDIDAARDILHGRGCVFRWMDQDKATGYDAMSGERDPVSAMRVAAVPRNVGESVCDWVRRTLEARKRFEEREQERRQREAGQFATVPSPVAARRFAPVSRETTEKEKRGAGDNPFSHGSPPPISYPEPTAAHRNTRLIVHMSKVLAAGLLHTDTEAVAMPWETFDLVIIGSLGWVDRIRCTNRTFESLVSVAGAVVPRLDVWDPQRRMVENILYGFCALVAEAPKSSRSGYGGSVTHGGEIEPATDALSRAPCDIEIDLVREAEEQLSSSTPGLRQKFGRSSLVRGHIANQPCGPGGEDRRRIWRRPHYSPRLGLMRAEQKYTVLTEAV